MAQSIEDATLPTGWNTGWEKAKRTISYTPACIAVLGTSISWGKGSTDFYAKGWAGRLKALLNSTYGVTGEHIPPQYSAGSSATGTVPWLHSSITNYADLYGQAFAWASSAGILTTFTSPYACTSLDIVHYDFAAGTWHFTVDGIAAPTVTTTASTKQVKTSYTGLTSDVHVVAIGNNSASNTPFLAGINIYTNTTSGIWFARMAYSGASVTDYIATSPGPADRPILWQGIYAGGTTGFGFPTQPQLAIIELSVNDCTNAVTQVNYQSGLRRLVQALRRGSSDCSILFLVPCYPDGVNSDANVGGAPTTYFNYIAYIHQIAQSFNCGVLNVHARWGETPFAGGLLTASDIHPTDSGHQDIANFVFSIL